MERRTASRVIIMSLGVVLVSSGVLSRIPLGITQTVSTTGNSAAIAQGQTLYQHICSYCHGSHGQGGAHGSTAPRLWGKNNVIQGSAYDSPQALSRFIQQYMPAEPTYGVNPGSLTRTQARNVTTYLLQKSK